MYQFLTKYPRNCSRVLPTVGSNVPNLRHGKVSNFGYTVLRRFTSETACLSSTRSSHHFSNYNHSFSLFYIIINLSCTPVYIFFFSQEFSLDPVIPIYSARPDMVKKALKYVHSAVRDKLGGKELELLIAILPDNNGSLYGMIPSHSNISSH